MTAEDQVTADHLIGENFTGPAVMLGFEATVPFALIPAAVAAPEIIGVTCTASDSLYWNLNTVINNSMVNNPSAWDLLGTGIVVATATLTGSQNAPSYPTTPWQWVSLNAGFVNTSLNNIGSIQLQFPPTAGSSPYIMGSQGTQVNAPPVHISP